MEDGWSKVGESKVNIDRFIIKTWGEWWWAGVWIGLGFEVVGFWVGCFIIWILGSSSKRGPFGCMKFNTRTIFVIY